MEICSADSYHAAEKAAAHLRRPGAVVLLPTETLYGLVCRASDEAAIDRIFQLKQRPRSKVVGWFVSGIGMLNRHGVLTGGLPELLIKQYTPGALTIIAKRQDGATQGFRIPDHQLIRDILHELDEPLVQTSANVSGCADPLSCTEALGQLGDDIDFAVDAGNLPDDACGSTVVDATAAELKIIRHGKVDLSGFKLF